MSFFDEVTNVWQVSKLEKMRIEQNNEELTDFERRAIDRVTQFCICYSHRPKIIAAAKRLERRYWLHKGHDLTGLIHFSKAIQKQVIDSILQTVQSHYGYGFTVSYFDDDNNPFRNAVFVLSW
jgi:hypothetical protein